MFRLMNHSVTLRVEPLQFTVLAHIDSASLETTMPAYDPPLAPTDPPMQPAPRRWWSRGNDKPAEAADSAEMDVGYESALPWLSTQDEPPEGILSIDPKA
jgi:hypothetical protein